MSNISSVRISDAPMDYAYAIPSAILMDGLLHSFCLGFVLALGLKYWEEYGEDSLRKRVFVSAVVVLSILQTILEDYKVWTVAVFKQPWAGSPFMWTDFFLNGIICSMCQAFYIRRCWKMTGKSPWALYPMIILWLSAVAAGFYISITMIIEFQHFSVSHFLNEQVERLFRNTVIVFDAWVVESSVLDFAVAAILITCLLKSKTGLDSSNSVVNRVVLLTLETALLPSMSSLAAVIILHGAPRPGEHDDLVLFFVYMTAKLYTIGLLRTLNSRAKLRQRIDSTDLGRTSLATWSWEQDHLKQQEPSKKPDRLSKLTMETATTLRPSVESSAPTYTYHAPCEEIVPEEGPSAGSPRVHFDSPLLDRYERGSYARLRVSSIPRTRPPVDEIDENP